MDNTLLFYHIFPASFLIFKNVRFDVILLQLIDLKNLFINRLVKNSDPDVIKHVHTSLSFKELVWK